MCDAPPTPLRDTPSGDCDVVSFTLSGQPFMAISAGGWLKDKYGLSWQVVPTALDEMMQDEDPQRRRQLRP